MDSNKRSIQHFRRNTTTMSIAQVIGLFSLKIYDKRDAFYFDIVNYSSLDGDVSRATSCRVYISKLIRFARACSSVEDFHI